MSKWKPKPGEALSAREREVLALRAEGLTLRECGEKLFIEPRTVAFHCGSIYRKLGVHSLLQALQKIHEMEGEAGRGKPVRCNRG